MIHALSLAARRRILRRRRVQCDRDPRHTRSLRPVGLPKLVAPGHRWIGNIERHSDCASAWTRCRSGSRDDNHRRRIADRAASPRIFGSCSAQRVPRSHRAGGVFVLKWTCGEGIDARKRGTTTFAVDVADVVARPLAEEASVLTTYLLNPDLEMLEQLRP